MYYVKLFTATPPLVIGMFHSTYSTETRLMYPQLYSQTENVFNYKTFLIWLAIAVFHSVIVFWICVFIMKNEVLWAEGRVGDYSVFGNIIYTVMF